MRWRVGRPSSVSDGKINPAYTSFAVIIGYLSAVTNERDVCQIESSAPHLHMDAPRTATKNTSLRNG